jgi:hypothetical protein
MQPSARMAAVKLADVDLDRQYTYSTVQAAFSTHPNVLVGVCHMLRPFVCADGHPKDRQGVRTQSLCCQL